jgi:hypothetical protein
MQENSKSSEPRDDRTTREVVHDRLEMLCAVFNRKCSDQLIVVYQDCLEKFPPFAVKKGFTKAETELERFPTPKILRELCQGQMPSSGWQYTYKDSTSLDRDTGQIVPCKIDPVTNEELFRPQNCKEGRAFLAKLKELSLAKSI